MTATFFTLSAKLILNVHDLNNEAVAGNVSDIRVIDYIGLDGKRREAPAVSGRMLKHWHLALMTELAKATSLQLCAGCETGEPIRPGKKDGDKIIQVAIPEDEAIKNCTICDVHGYLIAKEAKKEEKKGATGRHTSRVSFSWLLPALDTETTSKQVVHTRVSRQIYLEEEEKQKALVIFSKSYASGIYAFVSAVDLARIGWAETLSNAVINEEARKKRANAAIQAYRDMLSGKMGASLSHALPHTDILEVAAAVSTQGPLPFPASPIYPDYLLKYAGILPVDKVKAFSFGIGSPPAPFKSVSDVNRIFEEVLNLI